MLLALICIAVLSVVGLVALACWILMACQRSLDEYADEVDAYERDVKAYEAEVDAFKAEVNERRVGS